ncbi:MAG: FGGY family carbohydrate kinase [Parafilimonas sp.]
MQNVIAVFDVGKTNKKLVLFNEDYDIVHEENVQLDETTDEDNFLCEDVYALTKWIKNSFDTICQDSRFNIKAINFSGYGASLVYVDDKNEIAAPLYNYLKPYPQKLQQKFYKKYGGESVVAKQTASPVLGSLNAGMQLYRLKNERPELLSSIKYALHLPQYLSFILTHKPATDITSIGCHTNLWNFAEHAYHKWVYAEKLEKYFAPVLPADAVALFEYNNKKYFAGIGLHDSSAALIPYLHSFKEPFILLSTGTWCISLNPSNHSMLTDYELHQDCLCFFSYKAELIKASRLFAGFEHELQVKRLAEYFNKPADYYTTVKYDASCIKKINRKNISPAVANAHAMVQQTLFKDRELTKFKTYEQAYHQFIFDVMIQQVHSLKLVLQDNIKKIFVDGGFSKNDVYMSLLAASFPAIEVYAAKVSHASALGAALVMHKHWNKNAVPNNLIELKKY